LVESSQTPTEKIRWKVLIFEMEEEFGKFRPHNKIKNYWYIRRRKLARVENQKKVGRELDLPSECGHYVTLSTRVRQMSGTPYTKNSNNYFRNVPGNRECLDRASTCRTLLSTLEPKFESNINFPLYNMKPNFNF
jgi:hypothetical protein